MSKHEITYVEENIDGKTELVKIEMNHQEQMGYCRLQSNRSIG
jgi:hypothetical protein